jgi:hypothetical protein
LHLIRVQEDVVKRLFLLLAMILIVVPTPPTLREHLKAAQGLQSNAGRK